MITNALYCKEYRGKSTDDKSSIAQFFPDGKIVNGTVFFEEDTSKVFMYDGETEAWLPL